ncbi:MAG: 4Fe-4S single cluster domain-containing protein [Chloroflexota bacterium]
MPDSVHLRVHHFQPESRANGPGCRAVLWVQGCTLGCLGCFNPGTHDPRGGDLWAVDDLVVRLAALQTHIQGLTVSGGEPLQQPKALFILLQRLRAAMQLSVLVFTGFTWEEVQRLPNGPAILAHIDVLIAGRYDASQRLAHGLLGSVNQRVHFLTGRYSPAELAGVPEAEVTITPQGELWLSGIAPLNFDSAR